MFLGFVNFYQQFIQRFSWIAVSFISMLKTLKCTESATQPGEGVVGVNGDNRARRNKSKLDGSEFDSSEIDGSEVKDDEVEKKIQKTSKPKISS